MNKPIMSKKGDLVSLSEFRRIAGLSAESTLQLIEQRLVDLELDSERGLMIDTRSVTNQRLLAAIRGARTQRLEQDTPLLQEQIASVVSDELDRILDMALAELGQKG